MNTNEVLNKLNAEIERQIKSIENATGDFAEGRRWELENLRNLITSLQQEHPQVADASKIEQPEVDYSEFEKAITKYRPQSGSQEIMTRAEEAALKAYPPMNNAPHEVYFLRDGYINGYEQAEKETINRACEWLFSHLPILLDYYNEDIHEKADRSKFIKLFRTQMEEEQ